MPLTPVPLIGRRVTLVAITPLISDPVGDLTEAALGPQTVTAIVDNMQLTGRVTTQEISALTGTERNEVPIERADQVVFTEIMRAAAGSVIAAAVWTGADNPDWALFQTIRGGTPYNFYGLLSRYEEDVQKGKSVARLTFLAIDTGAAPNPEYS